MDPKLSYREMAVQGASPARLVALLYEQAINDIRRALRAQEKNQIEERTRHLNHAILVIAHLETSLDKEQGGKVAQDLERFYGQVRSGLVAAQMRQSAAAMRQLLIDLMEVRQAWEQVDQQSRPVMAAEPPSLPQVPSEAEGSSEWNA